MNYKRNRQISCFGSKARGFKLCDCLVDVTLGALENIETINDLWRIYEEKNKFGLGQNLFWTCHNGFFLGCCRADIEWLFLNLPIIPKCNHIRAISFEKCCFNLDCELHDFCFHCLDVLSDILVKKLHTFITPAEIRTFFY